MTRSNGTRANGERSMNWYRNWLKTRRYSISQAVRHGCRFVLQPFAFCNTAVVAFLFVLMISAPAQAKPISIKLMQDMAFGTLAGDGTLAGTAVINPSTGVKSVTGGVFDLGGIHNPAIFEVKGDKNTTFNITLPGAVTLTSGGNSMTLNNFTSSPSGSGVPTGPNGKVDVTVGATLQVGVNQAAGTYSGVFTVTVNY